MNAQDLLDALVWPTAPIPAKLVLSRWQMDLIDALPDDERAAALQLIDDMAAAHGLLTPTEIVVVAE